MKTIRLQTRRHNIAFMVMTALSFALWHPTADVCLPIKVPRMLFGSGIGVSTLRLLTALTWQGETSECLPVFVDVWPDQPMKVTVGFFQGLTDVTALAFRYAEKEIEGAWDAWTPQNLEKLFLSELTAAQTPAGSTMIRKVKYCPVCRKALGTFFYGSAEELRQLIGGQRLEKTRFIVGSPSSPEPRPKWMCPGCGIKIWQGQCLV